MFYVYVLKSINFFKTYVVRTSNLERRLREHNSGMGNFTRRYKPWKLFYFEKFDLWEEAFKREKYLKSAVGRRWMKRNLF